MSTVLRRLFNVTLSGPVARATGWAFSLHASVGLLGLIRTVVLAALLGPRELGLFGVAFVSTAIIDKLTRTGFDQALIQRREASSAHLDVAWTISIMRGLGLAVVLYAVAPFVGRFFEEPAVVPLLRVVGLSPLIHGFTNVAVVTFQRNLTFDREFAFRGSGILVDAVVAIAVAVAWRNAWALGVGTLAGALVQVLASFRLHPYRPRLSLALAPLRDLFRYGRWVTVSEALTVVAAQGAGLVVGKTLGLTALGIYDMAKRIPQLAIAEPGTKLSQVALPVYAKARGDARRLADGYWRIVGLAAVMALPAAVGLWIVSETLVAVALGDLWVPVVQPLQIFVGSALCLSTARTARPVLLASGQPEVVFKLEVVRAALLAVTIYPLVLRFGVSGAAMAMLLASATLLVVSFAHLRRQLSPSATMVRRTFVPALVSSLLMGLAVLGVQHVTAGWSDGSDLRELSGLVGMIALVGLVYCGASAVFARFTPRGPAQELGAK